MDHSRHPLVVPTTGPSRRRRFIARPTASEFVLRTITAATHETARAPIQPVGRWWGTSMAKPLPRSFPDAGRERRATTWRSGIPAWSALAIASGIVVASAAGAGLTPLMRTVEASPRSDYTTWAGEPARACTGAVRAERHAGGDHALPVRHRNPIHKRSGRRFGVLPSGADPCRERLIADIPTTSQGNPPAA